MRSLRFVFYAAVAAAVMELPNLIPPFEVPPGDIGTTNGKEIVSRHFYSCSAVVLDEDNKAVMAHALEADTPYTTPGFVYAGNVVDKLLGLHYLPSPEHSAAHIYAGDQKSLDIIVRGFQEHHIRIASAELAEHDKKIVRMFTVRYNPVNDALNVELE